jgi:hypothetical protein
VAIGTTNARDHISSFCDTTWLTCNRPVKLKESTVAPGETGTFEFWLDIPYAVNGSTVKESFNLVAEGASWMNDIGQYFSFTTNTTDYAWQYVNQYSYTDSARTTINNLSSTSKNTKYYLTLKAKNVGGQIWTNDSVKLGTSTPKDRVSSFCNLTWITCNRPVKLKETSVSPGQTGTFEFNITTPNNSGTYNEYFTPVKEGTAWFNDLGLFWQITVN